MANSAQIMARHCIDQLFHLEILQSLYKIKKEAEVSDQAEVSDLYGCGTTFYWKKGEVWITALQYPSVQVSVTVKSEAVWTKFMEEDDNRVFFFDEDMDMHTFSIRSESDVNRAMEGIRLLNAVRLSVGV
jgi:hypothetical protein